MKRKIAIVLWVSIMMLSGCEKQNVEVNEKTNIEVIEDKAVEEKELESVKIEYKEKKEVEGQILEGAVLRDGKSIPINVTFDILDIQRGNDAFITLSESDMNVEQADENEEYVIVTFNITYNEGEVDNIFFEQSTASLESARLYFALSNGSSNAEDVSGYLSNNVYNLIISKGECAQGAVAFLREKNSNEPLYFVGFGKILQFKINE